MGLLVQQKDLLVQIKDLLVLRHLLVTAQQALLKTSSIVH